MENELMDSLSERMQKAIEVLRQDFAGLRTGRANVALLDKVMVEAYGAKTPLQHLATVNVLEPRVLGVQIWDASNIKAVEKAIYEHINIAPLVEGTLMKIMMPEMSEEVRRDILKMAATFAERARVGIRNIRRECIEKVKSAEKDGELAEDDSRRLQTRISQETTKFVNEVDTLFEDKSKKVQAV